MIHSGDGMEKVMKL